MSSIAGASECRGLCFGLVTILSQDGLAFQRTDCTPHHATPKCAVARRAPACAGPLSPSSTSTQTEHECTMPVNPSTWIDWYGGS